MEFDAKQVRFILQAWGRNNYCQVYGAGGLAEYMQCDPETIKKLLWHYSMIPDYPNCPKTKAPRFTEAELDAKFPSFGSLAQCLSPQCTFIPKALSSPTESSKPQQVSGAT